MCQISRSQIKSYVGVLSRSDGTCNTLAARSDPDALAGGLLESHLWYPGILRWRPKSPHFAGHSSLGGIFMRGFLIPNLKSRALRLPPVSEF